MNDNEGRTFWDYVGLGNAVGTCFIAILLFLIYVLGAAAVIEKGLELDRLSDQLDNGQRQYVYATPTPQPHVEQPSRGEIMRERAKRGREQRRRDRQGERVTSFPFPFR